MINNKIKLNIKTLKSLNNIGFAITSPVDRITLDNLLNSEEERVKIILANCYDFKLTKDQIECGLRDYSEEVRAEFAKRTDYKPNKKQIERGLTDKYQIVRSAFYRRKDVKLSEVQKIRAKKGSFNVHVSTSIEDFDEPDLVCPFCKTWILAEPDTWCKHVAYIYAPPEILGGIEKGPAANAQYEKWLIKNGVKFGECTRKTFNLFCKHFHFKKRNVSGEDCCGFECGNVTFAFTDIKCD